MITEMREKIDYTKVEYENIIRHYDELNAWKDQNTFPIKNASEFNTQALDNINALEFSFSGSHGDSYISQKLFEQFDRFLKLLISKINMPAYLFKVEHKAQIPNRIRTHKGILPKTIKDSDSYQNEFFLTTGNSIFGSFIKLNEENFSECKEVFYDSETSFIFFSNKKSILSRDFTNDIIQNKMVHGTTSHLNYLRLITDYCADDDMIIRMGGDGGDRYISVQMFFNKKSSLTGELRTIL
jgi:hypothetical protein